MHILPTDNMIVLQRRPQKKRVPAAEYQHLSACLKSIIGVWGSRNCVMTSSEMRAIHTRHHCRRWLKSTQKRIMRWSKMSKVWHIVHQNPHFQGQGMQWKYQKCPRVNALQDSHWQHAENSSSKPGKLAWMPVSTLANFTGSNNKYTFSGHTVVGNSAHWLHLSTFPPVEDTLPHIPRGSSNLEVRPWMPVHTLTSCTWSNREIVNTYFY